MKNIFVTLVCVLCVLLCGCNGNKTDDGVGTTSQKKTDTSYGANLAYTSERDVVKTVKIDGYLYYETDEETDVLFKDSEPVGNFNKNADGFELPVSNNESNFYDGVYYSGTTEDSLIIPVGDDMEIFRKISNNEGIDASNYKYIMKLEGRSEYSVYEEEYIVLTNDINLKVADAAQKFYKPESISDSDIYIVESFADDNWFFREFLYSFSVIPARKN